jgi:hypothetical protein
MIAVKETTVVAMIALKETTVRAIIDVRMSSAIGAKITEYRMETATGTVKAPPLSSGASSAAFLCMEFQ